MKDVSSPTPPSKSKDKRYLDTKNVNRLIDLAKNGDSKALGELIDINQGLIRKIVFKYVNRGIEFEDLLQEGYLASVRAIFDYDVTRNVKFSTFLGTYIEHQMWTVLENRAVIRIGRLSSKCGKFFQSCEDLEKKLKRRPTVEEITKHSGIKLSAVKVLSYVENFNPCSLNSSVVPNTNLLLSDIIEDKQGDDLDNDCSIDLIKKLLANSEFSEKKKKIFRLRYGLDDGVDRTMVETGEMFGISRQRVDQIEKKILDYLRVKLVKRRR